MTLERLYSELRARGYYRLSRKRKKELKCLLAEYNKREAEIAKTCMTWTSLACGRLTH